MIQPIGDRILLQPVAKVAAGSITYTPKSPTTALFTVLEIGPEVQNEHIVCGSTVLMGAYAGVDYTEGEERYVIAKEEELLGIVRHALPPLPLEDIPFSDL